MDYTGISGIICGLFVGLLGLEPLTILHGQQKVRE